MTTLRVLSVSFVSALLLSTAAIAQTPAPAKAPSAPVTAPQARPFTLVSGPMDIVVGEAKAPVTIVEYASLSCPHCANFHNTVYPELKKKYIDGGKVRMVFRHFPLNAPALGGAVAVSCVEPAERVKYLKVLFAAQDKWAFDTNYPAAIENIVSVGGLGKEKLTACQADKKLEAAILNVRKEAGEKGWVDSTPTFYINGQKFVGERNIEQFSQAIDALLKTK